MMSFGVNTTMKAFPYIFIVLMCVCVGFISLAQDDTFTPITQNGAWVRFEQFDMSMAFPPTWTRFVNDNGFTIFQSSDGTARMEFNQQVLGTALPVSVILQDATNSFQDNFNVLASEIISLPIGEAGRIDVLATFGEEQLRLIQWLITSEDQLLLIQAVTVANNEQITNVNLATMTQIVNTLQLTTEVEVIDAWSIQQDERGALQMRVPLDWEQTENTSNSLTITNSNEQSSITINIQRLPEIPTNLDELQFILEEIYRQQGITTNNTIQLSIPLGDVIQTQFPDITVERNTGEIIELTQEQYAVLRGDILLIINISAPDDRWDVLLPLFKQMIDTIEIVNSLVIN